MVPSFPPLAGMGSCSAAYPDRPCLPVQTAQAFRLRYNLALPGCHGNSNLGFCKYHSEKRLPSAPTVPSLTRRRGDQQQGNRILETQHEPATRRGNSAASQSARTIAGDRPGGGDKRLDPRQGRRRVRWRPGGRLDVEKDFARQQRDHARKVELPGARRAALVNRLVKDGFRRRGRCERPIVQLGIADEIGRANPARPARPPSLR